VSWDGKVAVVTGASRGIGREMCVALAAAGVRVFAAARSLDAPTVGAGTLVETVAAITEAGGEGTALALDVRDPHAVDSAFAEVQIRCGRLDLLVNNAGVMVGDLSFDKLAPSIWSQILETNLSGAYHCCRAALPALLRGGGGVIVNVTSGAAVRTGFLNLAYGVSKAGLDRLTLGLADEYRERGLAAISLSPSVSNTASVRRMYPDRDLADSARPPEWPAKALVELLTHDDPMRYSGQVLAVRGYLQHRGLIDTEAS